MEKRESIYKKVFTIGVPVAIENTIYSLMNFIDVFMVGKNIPLLGLGTAAVAGLGFANQLYLIFAIALFGMNSGGGILAAQYYGNKDYKNLKKCLGVTIAFGFLFSILFLSLAVIIPKEIIKIFTSDQKVIELGAKYLKIVSLTYPLVGVGFAFNMQLRAIGKTKYSFYSSIFGLIFNFIVNYLLIFGKFGFPAMGVEGAAIATVLSRLISTLYLIIVIYKLKLPLAGNFKELFYISFDFIIKVLKISLPVFIHEIFWVLGTSAYVVIFGRMGTDSAASIQIVKSISSLIFTLLFGLSSATSAIIGQEIGAGREKEAYNYAISLLKASIIIGIVVAILSYLLSPYVLILMDVPTNIYPLTKKIILSDSIVLIIKSISLQLIVGILRSGGDTFWTMLVDLIPLWLVAIPLTYIVGLKLLWPVYIVYLISGIDELIKIYPCVIRLKSKKWINNLVK